MCSWGSEDIAGWIMEANNDPAISAIVLEINSGGGQVDGTQLLGEVVRASQKPVVAWVAGMAASAAYWVASQAREIVMESETTSEVGSIGVIAMHVDATKALEQEGYKVTIVRSDGSADKALFNSFEPLSEAVINDTKASLNLIRQTFEKTVKAGRPGISADVFTGKMYAGKDAIRLGMADRIGYLGDAVRRADLLARKS
ncbi:S49 family peptidase, partial [Arsenicibacter rosenii]